MPVLSRSSSDKNHSQVENVNVSDFSPTFIKSDFSIFAYSQTRKLGCLKSKVFKHTSFRYSPMVKYENLDFKKSEISKYLPFLYLLMAKYENLDLSITWGIFQYITYSRDATCFGVEFCTVPRFLVETFGVKVRAVPNFFSKKCEHDLPNKITRIVIISYDG